MVSAKPLSGEAFDCGDFVQGVCARKADSLVV